MDYTAVEVSAAVWLATAGALLLVIGGWAWYIRNVDCVVRTLDDDGREVDRAARGQFGDAFGALTCLFTGLAIVGATAAVMLQSRELTEARAQAHEDKRLALLPGLHQEHLAAGEAIRTLTDLVFRPAAKIAEKRGLAAYLAWMQLVAEIMTGKRGGADAVEARALNMAPEGSPPMDLRPELWGEPWVGDGAENFKYVEQDNACFGRLWQRVETATDPEIGSGLSPIVVNGTITLPLAFCRRQVATFWERLGQLAQPLNVISSQGPVFPADNVLRHFDAGTNLPHLLALTIQHREQLDLPPPANCYGLHRLYAAWSESDEGKHCGWFQSVASEFEHWLHEQRDGRARIGGPTSTS